MFFNNDKETNSLDFLYDLDDNDIFGSKLISSLQQYDKYASTEFVYVEGNRPDVISKTNQYGYLLFANPKHTWDLGSTYKYYIEDVVLRSKADKILQL